MKYLTVNLNQKTFDELTSLNELHARRYKQTIIEQYDAWWFFSNKFVSSSTVTLCKLASSSKLVEARLFDELASLLSSSILARKLVFVSKTSLDELM